MLYWPRPPRPVGVANDHCYHKRSGADAIKDPSPPHSLEEGSEGGEGGERDTRKCLLCNVAGDTSDMVSWHVKVM